MWWVHLIYRVVELYSPCMRWVHLIYCVVGSCLPCMWWVHLIYWVVRSCSPCMWWVYHIYWVVGSCPSCMWWVHLTQWVIASCPLCMWWVHLIYKSSTKFGMMMMKNFITIFCYYPYWNINNGWCKIGVLLREKSHEIIDCNCQKSHPLFFFEKLIWMLGTKFSPCPIV